MIGDSLSLEEQTAALKAMASITTGTASIEIYSQLVLQRYQRLLKKRRSEQLEREEKAAFDLREAAERMTKSSQTSAVGNDSRAISMSTASQQGPQQDDNLKSTTHSLGSKRAKQLLQMANITPTPSKQTTEDHLVSNNPNPLLARLHQISSFEIASTTKPKSSLLSKDVRNERLQCTICREIAQVPCAAKCGHICCEKCWQQWLKVKQICPFCRAPASQSTLARVIVRSAP